MRGTTQQSTHEVLLPESETIQKQSKSIHNTFDSNAFRVSFKHTISADQSDQIQSKEGKEELERELKCIEEDGYVMLENVLTTQELEEVKDGLQEWLDLDQKGRNRF